jgi:hypothetical protein
MNASVAEWLAARRTTVPVWRIPSITSATSSASSSSARAWP